MQVARRLLRTQVIVCLRDTRVSCPTLRRALARYTPIVIVVIQLRLQDLR
jgi:hypothetical protein